MKVLKISTVLFVSALLTAFGGSQENPSQDGITRVARYASLPFRESPFPRFTGIAPITEKEGQTRNHYLVEYDNRERVKKVSFRLGSQVRDLNETANLFMRKPIMVVDYQPNREIVRWFDRFGNPAVIRGGVFKEIYHLDPLGNRQALTFLDINDQPMENAWEIARYQWEITGDGTVIEERFNSKGEPVQLRPGFDFFRILLHYRANGSLALMENVDDQGRPVANKSGAAADRLDFDARGYVLGWNVLNPSGQLTRGNGPNVARGIFSPNQWGYEAGTRFEDAQGNAIPTAYGFWNSKTTFDRHGNMTGRVFLKNGKPHPHETAGYTRMKVIWDRSGLNRLSLNYMDEQGKPVLHATRGYATAKTSYNRQNLPVRLTYLDAQMQPVARTDNGVAVIERDYDARGRHTETRFLDLAGNLTNHQQRGYSRTVYHYDSKGRPSGSTHYNSSREPVAATQ